MAKSFTQQFNEARLAAEKKGKKLSPGEFKAQQNGITATAQPGAAQQALGEASKAGAFTISDNAPEAPADALSEAPVETAGLEESAEEPIFKDQKEQAKSLAESRREEFNKASTELGFEEGLLPTSLEQQVEELKETQKNELAFQTRQAAVARESEKAQFEESTEQAEAAKSATEATLAPSREGVFSEGAPKAIAQFKATVQRRIDTAQSQIRLSNERRDRAIEQFKKAQKSQSAGLAESLQREIASAQQDIIDSETELLNAQQAAAESAMKIQTQEAAIRGQAFTTFGKLPAGSFAELSVGEIQEGFGIDFGTAATMKQLDIQRATLQLSDPDFLLKSAQVEKAEREAITAGMTTAQKNFMTYQQLLTTDPAGAKAFATEAGFVDDPTALEAARTAEINQAIAQKAWENQGIAVPVNGKWQPDIIGDSVSWANSVPDGTPLGARGECGAFVNDALFGGPGFMGDTFSQKMSKTNSLVPAPGGAFVENIGGATGHTGLVEQVFPDGSFSVRESNYSSDHTVSSAVIKKGSARWKSIVEQGGFYNGASGAKSETLQADKSLLSQFKQVARDAGLTSKKDIDEFAKSRLKDSFAKFTEAQGGAFKAAVVSQNEFNNYDEIVQGIPTEDFADSINVLTRKITDVEAPLTAEIVNRNLRGPKNAKIRGAIMSELRWVAAVLREESGAAISMGEYLNKGAQFFPRAGDDAGEISRKKRARELEQRTLLSKSGGRGARLFQEEFGVEDENPFDTISFGEEELDPTSFLDNF